MSIPSTRNLSASKSKTVAPAESKNAVSTGSLICTVVRLFFAWPPKARLVSTLTLPLREPHAWPAAVLGDKLDAGFFEGGLNAGDRSRPQFLPPEESSDCIARDLCRSREIVPIPSQPCAGHAALRRSHFQTFSTISLDALCSHIHRTNRPIVQGQNSRVECLHHPTRPNPRQGVPSDAQRCREVYNNYERRACAATTHAMDQHLKRRRIAAKKARDTV
jgi:hypothetical protein